MLQLYNRWAEDRPLATCCVTIEASVMYHAYCTQYKYIQRRIMDSLYYQWSDQLKYTHNYTETVVVRLEGMAKNAGTG